MRPTGETVREQSLRNYLEEIVATAASKAGTASNQHKLVFTDNTNIIASRRTGPFMYVQYNISTKRCESAD